MLSNCLMPTPSNNMGKEKKIKKKWTTRILIENILYPKCHFQKTNNNNNFLFSRISSCVQLKCKNKLVPLILSGDLLYRDFTFKLSVFSIPYGWFAFEIRTFFPLVTLNPFIFVSCYCDYLLLLFPKLF